MSNQILVPVDGSEHSRSVIDVAAALARAEDRALLLLHVVPTGSMPEGLQQWAEVEHVNLPPSQFYEQAVGMRILETFKELALKRGVSEVDTRIESGEPARCILDVARQSNCPMIVLGSRGLSDLEGLVFGGVAHRVCHAAECRVVTVR